MIAHCLLKILLALATLLAWLFFDDSPIVEALDNGKTWGAFNVAYEVWLMERSDDR